MAVSIGPKPNTATPGGDRASAHPETAKVGVEDLVGAENVKPCHRQSWRRYKGWVPEIPRPRFGTRGISVALRTVHLASFGILIGGHIFGIESDRLLTALCLTIASGIGLMALELLAVGPHWFFMGKGIVVLAKLALLLLVLFFREGRVQILLLVLVIGSVGSHMPGRYRHYSLVHRRAIGRRKALRYLFSGSWPGASTAASPDDKDFKRG